MPSLPLISIITPNYNYGHFIARTIESVLSSKSPKIEYIIIDDGSTDNSLEIIQSYASAHPDFIRVIAQKNAGHAEAVNNGMMAAHGKYIGWLNSADFFEPGALLHYLTYIERYPKVDIFFGNMNVVDQDGIFIFCHRQKNFSYWEGAIAAFGNVLCSNAIIWKKDLLDKVGYLDKNLHHTPDNEFFGRLAKSAKVKRLPFVIANWRIHSNSLSHGGVMNIDRERYEVEYLNAKMTDYSRIPISKLIPYRFSFPVKVIIMAKRVLIKMFMGHYIKKWIELKRYRRKVRSQQ